MIPPFKRESRSIRSVGFRGDKTIVAYMLPATALANSEHFTSFAPSINRAKS
jgi:hypothetical protein